MPTPRYLHVPLVTNAEGEKLSKQTGAQALDMARPLDELTAAARFLQLSIQKALSEGDFWKQAIDAWAERFAKD